MMTSLSLCLLEYVHLFLSLFSTFYISSESSLHPWQLSPWSAVFSLDHLLHCAAQTLSWYQSEHSQITLKTNNWLTSLILCRMKKHLKVVCCKLSSRTWTDFVDYLAGMIGEEAVMVSCPCISDFIIVTDKFLWSKNNTKVYNKKLIFLLIELFSL